MTVPSAPDQKQGPMLIVVMGVSGSGKSTLGAALAKEFRMPFIEGDDLHPKANIAKMSAGIPLNDADREPWLELLRTTAEQYVMEQQREAESTGKSRGVVMGCSALKRYYREILRGNLKYTSGKHGAAMVETVESTQAEVLPTYFVYVDGSREVLLDRMSRRPGHFMKASMLDSQLDALEIPIEEEGVVTVSLDSTTEKQVAAAKERLERIFAWNL